MTLVTGARAQRRAADAFVVPVLQSRLSPPKPRAGYVPRRALMRQLHAAHEPVITVVAPPGYGKTSLLVDWAEREGSAFAWLTVDESGNDPIVFATYLAAALERLGAACSPVFAALRRRRSPAGLTSLLHAAAASAAGDIVFVVDDAHLLHDERAAALLLGVRDGLDPAAKLVLAGRRTTAVIEAVRRRFDSFDVGGANLRLSAREALALLGGIGVEVDDAEAAELNERVEGWAAGLNLAALAMRASEPPVRAVDVAVDRLIGEYLMLEVLHDLPADAVDFLRRVAPLEPLSGPLADAVLGASDSAEKLAAFAEANVLLFELGATGETREPRYRMHHLLRDHLAAEEARYEPRRARTIYRRASSWYEDVARDGAGTAELLQAIDYAHAAGDRERVVALLEHGAPAAFGLPALESQARWFEQLADHDLLVAHPLVALLAARTYALLGDADRAHWFAGVALEAPEALQSERVRATADLVRAKLCRDGLADMAASAARAVAAGHEQWRASALCTAGVAALLSGDATAGEALLVQAEEGAGGRPTVRALALAERSTAAAARDEWAEAGDLARQSYDVMRESRLDDYPLMALTYAAGARVAAHAGDRLRADELLDRAYLLKPRVNEALPWLAVQVRLELAHAHVGRGEVRETSALLDEVDLLLGPRPDFVVSAAEAARLRASLAALLEPEDGWPATITTAERKLLPLLATHLTFREIAEELHISRNTVKTQAISLYRKLQASSRSEAIEAAAAVGLLRERQT